LFFASSIKGKVYRESVIGKKKGINIKSLKKLAAVHVTDIESFFTYKETAVKQKCFNRLTRGSMFFWIWSFLFFNCFSKTQIIIFDFQIDLI